MKVTLDNVEVDMSPRDFPAFTYSIQDPFDLAAIRGTRSTTAKIPATNTAKVVAGGAAMAEVTGKDQILRLMHAGTPYLTSKVRAIEHDRDEIRFVAVGNNAGWMKELKDRKLNTLDLGRTGIIDETYIRASWYDEDQTDYYPLIDYGFPDWYTVNIETDVERMRPAIRVHRALKKAFSDIGYDLRVNGRLNRYWKKFILPNVSKIKVDGEVLKANTMSIRQTDPTTVTGATDATPIQPIPILPNVITDPGGNYSNLYYYTAPFDMRVRVSFTMTVRTTANGANFGTARVGIIRSSDNTYINSAGAYPIPVGQTITVDETLGEVDLTVGQEIGVGWDFQNFVAGTVEIASMTMRVEPVNIEYQLGLSVDIGQSAPNLSCLDLLKTLVGSRCLVVNTNDQTKVVDLWLYEDYYRKHERAGIDFRGREDHSTAPVKKKAILPRSLHFKWKDDSKDKALEAANEQVGDRTWGGYIHEPPNGVDEEVTIELPMAATAMRYYPPGAVLIPHINDFSAPRFEWTPRLLMANGTAEGNWFLNHVAQTVYPKCFFVYPGETELSMAFGNEPEFGETGAGTIGNCWTSRLRRFDNALTLQMDVSLWDFELANMDYGAPRLMNDGDQDGWYYFGEIKQKRYGTDEPTQCELIPE